MKKLMFAAAVAATSMAFAATPAAQVYDVTFNIKTTKSASAKNVNHKTNPIAVADGDVVPTLYFRTQTSITWKGLIWGCNCEAIDGVWETVDPCYIDPKTGEAITEGGDTVKGCIVWDVKGKAPVYMGEKVNVADIDVTGNPGWEWDFLNLINKDAKGAECVFDIVGCNNVCGETDLETFDFRGAGFGNVQFSLIDGEVQCNSYVKKLSGGFAGWMLAPDVTMVTTTAAGCSFCGSVKETKVCNFVGAWDWCDFGSDCGCEIDVNADEDRTAAYGTWTIAYNSSLSSKLSNKTTILDAYNFKSLPLVAAAIATAEAQIKGERAACADYQDALDAANAAVTAAEKEIARVTTANLQKDLDNANDIAWKAWKVADLTNAIVNASIDATNTTYQAWDGAISATNCTWSFYYKNSSNDPVKLEGRGAKEMLDALAATSDRFTIFEKDCKDSMKPCFDGVYYDTVKAVTTELNRLLKDIDDTKKEYDTAVAKLATDQANLKTVTADYTAKQIKAAAAQADYDDRVALQAAADRALDKAEEAVAAADLALKACQAAQ